MSAYIDLQSKFAFNAARFLLWLEAQGYQVGLGEAWRTPEQAQIYADTGKGIANSLHRDRMAIDLIIRRNGQEVGPEDYKRCGEAWKAFDPLNRWGGDFKRYDGQHFSQTYQGRQ